MDHSRIDHVCSDTLRYGMCLAPLAGPFEPANDATVPEDRQAWHVDD